MAAKETKAPLAVRGSFGAEVRSTGLRQSAMATPMKLMLVSARDKQGRQFRDRATDCYRHSHLDHERDQHADHY